MTMCEKRARKIKKGSNIIRLREERRLQRLQRISSPPPAEVPRLCTVDREAQTKVLLELAWRTVALMQKNKIIQEKLVALRKETSEFFASIMKDPENHRRCMEYLATNGLAQAPKIDSSNQPLRVEPLKQLGRTAY